MEWNLMDHSNIRNRRLGAEANNVGSSYWWFEFPDFTHTHFFPNNIQNKKGGRGRGEPIRI